MYNGPPTRCPWHCYEIGGGWISHNPSCPFHGSDRVDLEELTQEEGDRMCAEQEALNAAPSDEDEP